MAIVYSSRTKTMKLPRVAALGAMAERERVCPLADKRCKGMRDSYYFERVCSHDFRDCYEGTIANEEEDK